MCCDSNSLQQSPYEEYCQKKAKYNRRVRERIMSGEISSVDDILDEDGEES